MNKFRRLLDALIVLAVAFALPIFWLIDKIIELRGNGGDEEKKNLREFSPIPPDDDSPPTEPPFFFNIARCPWRALINGKEEKHG